MQSENYFQSFQSGTIPLLKSQNMVKNVMQKMRKYLTQRELNLGQGDRITHVGWHQSHLSLEASVPYLSTEGPAAKTPPFSTRFNTLHKHTHN